MLLLLHQQQAAVDHRCVSRLLSSQANPFRYPARPLEVSSPSLYSHNWVSMHMHIVRSTINYSSLIIGHVYRPLPPPPSVVLKSTRSDDRMSPSSSSLYFYLILSSFILPLS